MKILLILMIASFSYIYAGVVGKVTEFKGIVKVSSSSSVIKKNITKGFEISEEDIITTSKNSVAKIVLKDNSILVLDQNSIVYFKNSKDLKQDQGRVYYKVTSKDLSNAMKITTDFAIIGIKGTTFIIKNDTDKELLLQEGEVGISSLKKEFALYRKKTDAAFENFKNQQQEGFESYKNSFEKYKKVQYTKAFDLKHDNKVSFSDETVKETGFDTTDRKEFQYFEKLINEI